MSEATIPMNPAATAGAGRMGESAWPGRWPAASAADPGPRTASSLAGCADRLLLAYLESIGGSRGIPLREFLWEIEREIVLASLRMTRGNQRRTAALLGVKPTALFHKARKFAINPRRLKLTARLQGRPPGAGGE
jgi:DNA-binding protein Fis